MSKRWLVLKKDSKLKPRAGKIIISVPRRVIRLSTARSRIKRLIREAVRTGRFGKSKQSLHFIVRDKAPKGLKMKDVVNFIQNAL